jgi:quinoprotein glucose dehydrogenase
MKHKILLGIVAIGVFIGATALQKHYLSDDVDWAEYLGGADRNHYSTLTQINPENVSKLQIAWSYSTPDSGQIQVNPIIVGGVLYGVTSAVQAFALDAQKLGKLKQRRNLLEGRQ